MTKNKSKGKNIIPLICFLVILLVALSIVIYSLLKNKKSNDISDYYNPIETIYFNNQFTDKKITDAPSAKNALLDVSNVLGISNVDDELDLVNETSIEGFNVYRFQQYYEGYRVFGKQIIVTADQKDSAYSLISNYQKINEINLSPKLSLEEAKSKTSEAENLDIVNLIDNGMVIYINDPDPILCYCFTVTRGMEELSSSFDLLVNADNGDIVFCNTDIFYDLSYNDNASVVKQVDLIGEDNNSRKVDISEYDNKYQFYDLERKIAVWEKNGNDDNFSNSSSIIWDKSTSCPSKEAVSLLKNIQDTYDYFENNFSYNSIDGNGSFNIEAFVNDKNKHNNACSWCYKDNNIARISIGTNKDTVTYGNWLDIIAHEYTHAVSGYKVNWSSKQGAAMNEAYSDIFGEIVEYYVTGSTDWKHHNSRNIADPSKGLSDESGTHIDHFNQYHEPTDNEIWKPFDELIFGNECHLQSTLISHVAYLMNKGYDDNTHHNTAIDMETLGKLWFYSMDFLPSDCTFFDCRNAIETAASILNSKGIYVSTYTISRAFDEVGIEDVNSVSFVNKEFTLSIFEADNVTKVSNYHIVVSKYENENFDNTIIDEDIRKESHKFKLDNGVYLFTVQGKNDYQHIMSFYAVVNDGLAQNNHIDFHSYWYNNKSANNTDKSKTDNSELSEVELLTAIKESSDYDIADWIYDDFDGNGTKEGFASFVIDGVNEYKEVRFISAAGDVTLMYESEKVFYVHNQHISLKNDQLELTCPTIVEKYGSKFVGFYWGIEETYWGTDVFGVKNNIPYRLQISDEIRGLIQLDDGIYTFDPDVLDYGAVYSQVALKYDEDSHELSIDKFSAEEIADIVINNEELWLDTMNNIDSFTDANFCWFDDIDFDGNLEFIVGGSNWSDGDGWVPSTNRYYIYKFTSDNKMEIIKEYDDANIDFVTFFANHRYVVSSPGHGFSDIGVEVIKHTETGKYERVYITEATGGDYYGFYTVSITSDKITENSLGGFDKLVELYTENEYWDNIINPIANYMEDAVGYIDHVYAIPCTYMSDGYMVNDYGCYDNLTRSEKKEALISSYEGYRLEETSNGSSVLEKYLAEARTLNRDGNYVSKRDPDADTVFQMPSRVTN